MAKKKPLLNQAAELLMEIDENFDLKKTDPTLHKRIVSLLNDVSEKYDEGPDELDDEWFYDNGY